MQEIDQFDPELADLRESIELWLTERGANGAAMEQMIDEIMADIWRGNGIVLRALIKEEIEDAQTPLHTGQN